jgi:predicted RNase H-like HicB family nuclease
MSRRAEATGNSSVTSRQSFGAASETGHADWDITQHREAVRGDFEVSIMTSYIAFLFKDPDSDYGVAFPDFPGCVTAGSTLEDARRLAQEVLEFHIDGMRGGGETIPEPSTLDEIANDADFEGGFHFLVDVPDPPGRSLRVNVMLPEDLIHAIDRTTKNRSRFLAEAARERLARIKA